MVKTGWLVLICILSSLAGWGQKKAPKLIVGVVVDQMRADYLYRFAHHYGEDGFVRLMKEGVNYQNCHYNYVPTFTGPGHASIYTGTTPANHGIVANTWFSKAEQKRVNCVEDVTSLPVGSSEKTEGNFSPARLKANTITDQIKLTDSRAKILSVSIKNRGAILPGGHHPDGAYWYDYSNGGFMTGTYYRAKLPEWVATFNKENAAQTYFPESWETVKPISTYLESREDDYTFERAVTGDKPVFPYDLKKAVKKGESLTKIFVQTPFANTFLTDFAKKGIVSEELGKDEVTDFLAVSYSSPDIIGHSYGPYSKEMQDVMIRLDRDIADLLHFLDESVGKGEYLLFLTADHAVEPIPQYLIDHKMAAGYFFYKPFIEQIKKKAEEKFGKDIVSDVYNYSIYLNDSLIRANGFDKQEVVTFVRDEVAAYEHVKQAYTSSELMNNNFVHDWSVRIAKGFHPAEAGDVLFTLEPGYLGVKEDSFASKQGTSHGSVFNYDTQVPLIFFGKGISSTNVYREVEITDITPTLAILLGLTKPGGTTGKILTELLENK